MNIEEKNPDSRIPTCSVPITDCGSYEIRQQPSQLQTKVLKDEGIDLLTRVDLLSMYTTILNRRRLRHNTKKTSSKLPEDGRLSA